LNGFLQIPGELLGYIHVLKVCSRRLICVEIDNPILDWDKQGLFPLRVVLLKTHRTGLEPLFWPGSLCTGTLFVEHKGLMDRNTGGENS
jgi:hypothetical protein